jgi:hypothetical protein
MVRAREPLGRTHAGGGGVGFAAACAVAAVGEAAGCAHPKAWSRAPIAIPRVRTASKRLAANIAHE